MKILNKEEMKKMPNGNSIYVISTRDFRWRNPYNNRKNR